LHHFHNPYVTTSQFSPEFDRLIELYEELQPKRVLEIGSQFGGTLWHWLRLAKPGARVLNIDPLWGNGSQLFNPLFAWRSWVPKGVEFTTLIGYSQTDGFAQKALEWLGGPPDFCFIDGDHTYQGVLKDWQDYGAQSKVTAFHDLTQHKPHFGVHLLFDEIKADRRTDEFWSDGPGIQNGGGIGVAYID
jgi:hypothetical protein